MIVPTSFCDTAEEAAVPLRPVHLARAGGWPTSIVPVSSVAICALLFDTSCLGGACLGDANPREYRVYRDAFFSAECVVTARL